MKEQKGILQLVKTDRDEPSIKFYLTRTVKHKGKDIKTKMGIEITRLAFATILVAAKDKDQGVPCTVTMHTKDLEKLGTFGSDDPSDKKKKKKGK